jgi:hypothetical protein
MQPGGVCEIRILKTREGTISGYFDNLESALKAIAGLNGSGPGVYVTLNQVQPALLARAANRLKPRATVTTSDKDITARRRLLVDCDPVRPADISSTGAEHEAALERVRAIRFELSEEGWPAPVLADSGNGGHLIWLIDLPNDAESEQLIQRFLKALAARFDDEAVHVDQTVFNASRIVKLYGTVAAKGDNIAERPHRLSRILDVPTKLEVVPRELLEEFAATWKEPEAPRPAASAGKGAFNIDTFIAQHLRARAAVPHDGGRKWVLDECCFNPEHKAPDAAVFQHADGKLGFKCLHNSCAGKGWRDVRELFDGPPRQRSNSQRAEAPPPEEKTAKKDTGILMTKNVTEIPAEHIEWLWPHKIPRGKLTLLVGDPGLGKSLLTVHLAAVVSTGGCWPLGGACTPPGDVLFVSAEDDPGDTLRPRLEAAGADLRRIHILQGALAGYTGEGRQCIRMFDLSKDIDALSHLLLKIPQTVAVIIDPISAYLGEKCDSHKNAEVRAVLAPLITIVAERNVALIGITHLSKAGGPSALLRIIGSLAFVATARAAYLVAPDAQDKSRRLFLPIKSNLSPDASGLAFRIEGVTIPSPVGPIETARVVWEPEPVTISADEAIRPQEPPRDSVLGQATEWLQWKLREPTEANEIYASAAKMKIVPITIRRAAQSLGVKKRKNGMEGRWVWSLPDDPDDPEGDQGDQGDQDYQGRKDDHLRSGAAQDATPHDHHDQDDHLDHLESSKGLRALDHLDPPDDDEFTEVEL